MDGGSWWHCTGGSDQEHPQEKEMQKGKILSEEALQIAERRREAKGKGEKGRYTHLNAEFQRMVRRDKKAFLSDQSNYWKKVKVKSLSHVGLFVTPWTVAYQAPPSMGFSLQARILEWVAISFSRGSSQPRDQTLVSCIAGRFFTFWATRETQHISL